MCLFVYLKYKFASTCFCSCVLQLITQVLDVLVVNLCKPVIHKLKILSRGNLNIINQWGEPQKLGQQNFEISVGGSKRGGHDF